MRNPRKYPTRGIGFLVLRHRRAHYGGGRALNLLLLEMDHELFGLWSVFFFLNVPEPNESWLPNQVHELEISSTDLREKLEMYEEKIEQMKLLLVKCLNSNEYMEALGHALGRAIKKGMQDGLAARIEQGQAGRCLTNLEAYIPFAEDDFNSAIP
ncbi:hypothetical protein Tco_0612716 [Tanacetum coccineum]